MGLDEFRVTLEMLNIDYGYVTQGKKEYIEIRKNIISEEMKNIIKLLRQTNIEWHYLTLNGHTLGIYILYESV